MSKTALGVARIRAAETERADRLFADPFAAAFVAAAPGAYAEDAPPPRGRDDVRTVLARHVVVRTRFYDDYLLAATRGGIRQVVLLAAGLDTRALRLDWPDATRVFEVDLPAVVAFKAQVLAGVGAPATSDRVVVAADLTADWWTPLEAASFDDSVPTAWLVEGLLVYLGADEADALLRRVTSLSAPGSRLSCEAGGGAAALAARMPTETTSLWRGGVDDVPRWLTDHGWVVEQHELVALARGYGRDEPGPSRSAFVIASR